MTRLVELVLLVNDDAPEPTLRFVSRIAPVTPQPRLATAPSVVTRVTATSVSLEHVSAPAVTLRLVSLPLQDTSGPRLSTATAPTDVTRVTATAVLPVAANVLAPRSKSVWLRPPDTTGAAIRLVPMAVRVTTVTVAWVETPTHTVHKFAAATASTSV